jgi:hypothetical protein
MQPGQYQPARRAPKKSNGCLIAALIVGGILLVGVIVVAVGIYMVATSPAGMKAMSAVGDGIEVTKEAMNAPGTPELRALGCQQAMVMDLEKIQGIVQKYSDDAAPAKPATSKYRLQVSCQAGAGTAPSCADVADTYRKAVGKPAGKFVAIVQRSRNRRDCSKLYDVDGTDLGDHTIR